MHTLENGEEEGKAKIPYHTYLRYGRHCILADIGFLWMVYSREKSPKLLSTLQKEICSTHLYTICILITSFLIYRNVKECVYVCIISQKGGYQVYLVLLYKCKPCCYLC